MNEINSMLLCDAYKVGHTFQYPENTTLVYSNLTPRKSRIDGVEGMVFFGLQYFCKEYLIEHFNKNFFSKPKEEVVSSYKRRIKSFLGVDIASYKHIEDLHDLGYLPVKIKAVPEGTIVPMRVPCLTIVNTKPEFYWITNFLETLMSCVLWQPCTSATIAFEYKKILTKYAKETGMSMEFVPWQAHDFSFRGMSSPESSITSGMAHLTSFTGTDTIPAIDAVEKYYNANTDKELIGGSVAATEHSVMCCGGNENEVDTFKRLITKVYPDGIVSIVSDTWDLWRVLTEYMPQLKGEIMSRNGKVVIRPDSGDPADIICGTNNKTGGQTPQERGVIELLWNVFGGTINDKGFKILDPHVGAIYGDSITTTRAEDICKRLMDKGFASQVVFGVGSFTYQYNTRDTFGTAMKATYAIIDNDGKEIFKKPITDDGTKNSAKGLVKVVKDQHGNLKLLDCVNHEQESEGELKTVFEDGKIVTEVTFAEVRDTISRNL